MKEHKRLYKAGKNWVTATILTASVAAIGLYGASTAQAAVNDTASQTVQTNQVATNDSQQNDSASIKQPIATTSNAEDTQGSQTNAASQLKANASQASTTDAAQTPEELEQAIQKAQADYNQKKQASTDASNQYDQINDQIQRNQDKWAAVNEVTKAAGITQTLESKYSSSFFKQSQNPKSDADKVNYEIFSSGEQFMTLPFAPMYWYQLNSAALALMSAADQEEYTQAFNTITANLDQAMTNWKFLHGLDVQKDAANEKRTQAGKDLLAAENRLEALQDAKLKLPVYGVSIVYVRYTPNKNSDLYGETIVPNGADSIPVINARKGGSISADQLKATIQNNVPAGCTIKDGFTYPTAINGITGSEMIEVPVLQKATVHFVYGNYPSSSSAFQKIADGQDFSTYVGYDLYQDQNFKNLVQQKLPDGYELLSNAFNRSYEVPYENPSLNILIQQKPTTPTTQNFSQDISYQMVDGTVIKTVTGAITGTLTDGMGSVSADTVNSAIEKNLPENYVNISRKQTDDETITSTKPSTIVVHVRKIVTTVTYVFHDDTNNRMISGGTSVKGRAGYRQTLNLNIPEGYKLALGQILPTYVRMPGNDRTITIHLVKKTDADIYTTLDPAAVEAVTVKVGTTNIPAPTLKNGNFANSDTSRLALALAEAANNTGVKYPAGTIVAWDNPQQVQNDAQTAGTYNEEVVLHFPDGSISEPFTVSGVLKVTPATESFSQDIKYQTADGQVIRTVSEAIKGTLADGAASVAAGTVNDAIDNNLPSGYDYVSGKLTADESINSATPASLVVIVKQQTTTPVTPIKNVTVNYVLYDDTNKTMIPGGIQVSGQSGSTQTVNLTIPAGYKLADNQSLPTSLLMPADSDTITIHLVKVANPANTGNDQHNNKPDGNQGTKGNNQANHHDNSVNNGNTAKNTHSVQASRVLNKVSVANESHEKGIKHQQETKALPQTGNETDITPLAGLALASLATLFGLADLKKRY